MRKYEARVSPSGTFIPLIMSVYGTFAPQALAMRRKVVHAANRVCDDDEPILLLHSAMLQVACFRAVSLGLRGRGWMNPSGNSLSRPSRTRMALNAFEAPAVVGLLAPAPEVLRSAVGSGVVSVSPPALLPSGGGGR